MSRKNTQRPHSALLALGWLGKYAQRRHAEGYEQEATYNAGRTYHHLGASHLALEQVVFAPADPVAPSRDRHLGASHCLSGSSVSAPADPSPHHVTGRSPPPPTTTTSHPPTPTLPSPLTHHTCAGPPHHVARLAPRPRAVRGRAERRRREHTRWRNLLPPRPTAPSSGPVECGECGGGGDSSGSSTVKHCRLGK